MDIVEEIRSDPEKGAKRLDAEFRVGLTTLAMRFCHDASNAEDLVNRTFQEVCCCIDRYAEQSAFFAWMSKIMANIHANDIRRKSRQNEVLDGERHETEPDPDADALIYRHVDAAILREAIDTLPSDERKAVVMHYFLDIPVREAARVLSVPTGTFAWRLHNARMLLAAKLGAIVKKRGAKTILISLAAAFFLAASAAMVAMVVGGDPGDNGEPRDGDREVDAPAFGHPSGTARASVAAESTSRVVVSRPSCQPDMARSTSAQQTFPTTTQGEYQMNTNKVKSALLGIAAAAGAAIPLAAPAATTIAIDSVTQRWPWNNKVDITYTVGGGQDLVGGSYQKIVFTTVINGTTYTIDGTTDVGASANAGTHTVTWTLPDGVRSTNCTMSATIYASDTPSGDDYMIVDLTKTSDNVTYEGLLATQDDSNRRYNTATYKTDKLVLRKVPAGGSYPTGDSANYASANASKIWTTYRDYYIGVFPVTQYQYQKLYGSNPSEKTGATTGTNVKEHRPVEKVSWFDLRSPYYDNSTAFAPTSPIPTVASNSGTFFQRLNYITGNKFGFDLPTEVMFEIAERAGATTTYYWGNTMVTNYVVCSENCGNNTVAVGSRLPNSWGLYDMAGNVWEWCLDDSTANHNLANEIDPFAPLSDAAVWRRVRGGASWRDGLSQQSFRASYRYGITASLRYNYLGFRVSMIAD